MWTQTKTKRSAELVVIELDEPFDVSVYELVNEIATQLREGRELEITLWCSGWTFLTLGALAGHAPYHLSPTPWSELQAELLSRGIRFRLRRGSRRRRDDVELRGLLGGAQVRHV
jgi:hypothetical protein